MKICMLGSGSLGSALGGVLTEGGNDVYLIDAWPAHVEAMNTRGLTLRSGGVDRQVKVKARTTTDGIGPADLVVVLVKSFHTREAITAALRTAEPLVTTPNWATVSSLFVQYAPLAYVGFSALVDPGSLAVLAGSGVGRVCLVIGLALEALAALWMRRILATAEER